MSRFSTNINTGKSITESGKMRDFFRHQVLLLEQGGTGVILKKITKILMLPLYVIVLLIIRAIKPLCLVRMGGLINSRIGHFVANTELYLCELETGINRPRQFFIDLFYMPEKETCNHQLEIMWKRVLHVLPSWLLGPVFMLNSIIPGGAVHDIGNNIQHDRDVHNLLDVIPPHLQFKSKEISYGDTYLSAMGIPTGTSFVCLLARDSAYLETHQAGDWSYQNYRDCDINDCILAINELIRRGYFVIRVGAKVKEELNINHPRVIDYAVNGMRNDFMDIYLAWKCKFCIIAGAAGYGSVPAWGFRRPTVYTDVLPIGYLPTFSENFIFIAKKHLLSKSNRELTLTEIFAHEVGFCLESSGYASQDIKVVSNTPEEIRDIVVEMVERLDGSWQPHEDDEALQKQFWNIFPTNAVDPFRGRPLHGQIRARYGADFLRNNRSWLK